MVKQETIFPVLLAVPESARDLTAPSRVKFLSRHARSALAASAQLSDIKLGELKKDADGRPLPFDGINWSLTHKTDYVGAVVCRAEIGIDLEKIQSRSTRGLFAKTAAEEELGLVGEWSWDNFHRFWTAKEAVLKAVGTGLQDLSKCRVVEVSDSNNLVIACHGRQWPVEHYYFDGHVASVVKGDRIVEWVLQKSAS